jgi:hypothetical protein
MRRPVPSSLLTRQLDLDIALERDFSVALIDLNDADHWIGRYRWTLLAVEKDAHAILTARQREIVVEPSVRSVGRNATMKGRLSC